MKIINKKYFLLIFGYILGVLILGILIMSISTFIFDNPTILPGTDKAWQENMSEALITGYTDFDPLFVDSDTAAYIFSYNVPDNIESENAFLILKKQIVNFAVYQENKEELVLRKPRTYLHPDGFDEWRFVFNEKGNKMIVLLAKIDSAAEIKRYPMLIKQLRYHYEN